MSVDIILVVPSLFSVSPRLMKRTRKREKKFKFLANFLAKKLKLSGAMPIFFLNSDPVRHGALFRDIQTKIEIRNYTEEISMNNDLTTLRIRQIEKMLEPLQAKALTEEKIPQILIIEDEIEVRSILRELLVPYYQVVEAGTTPEVVRALAYAQPDLVTLDLNLPDGNGLEILDWFHDNSPAVPILIVTGNDSLESAEEAVRLQAAGFINKPLNPVHLLLTVQECLGMNARLKKRTANFSRLICKN